MANERTRHMPQFDSETNEWVKIPLWSATMDGLTCYFYGEKCEKLVVRLLCQSNEHVINQHRTGKTSMTFEFPTASRMFSLCFSLRSHHRLRICEWNFWYCFCFAVCLSCQWGKNAAVAKEVQIYSMHHRNTHIAWQSIGIIGPCVCVKSVQSTLDRIMFLVVLYRLNYGN